MSDEGLAEFVDGKWAIVWCPKEGFSLITPAMDDDDGERHVPAMGLVLTACMIRLEQDPEFRKECEDWFRQQAKS